MFLRVASFRQNAKNGNLNIALHRLINQQVAQHRWSKVGKLVAWLGAIQAQDYLGAKWSMALRIPGTIESDIDKAIATKTIIRTWPMRGTLHFVAAADVHWMRILLTPRIIAGSARRQDELELTTAVYARCEKIFIKALRGGRQVTREALCALLEKEKISAKGPRSYHIFWRLAQEGLLCFGAHEGSQSTFALLDEWAPNAKAREREDSLAELAKRYFIGHGPATLQDFVWWSGLKISDARAALEMAAPSLAKEIVEGKTYWMARDMPALPKDMEPVHLLPGFDEFLLGYTDRRATLDPKHAQKICPGFNGVFMNTVLIDGKVRGTWKRVIKKNAVTLTPIPFKSFIRAEKKDIAVVAERYGQYLGKNVNCAS